MATVTFTFAASTLMIGCTGLCICLPHCSPSADVFDTQSIEPAACAPAGSSVLGFDRRPAFSDKAYHLEKLRDLMRMRSRLTARLEETSKVAQSQAMTMAAIKAAMKFRQGPAARRDRAMLSSPGLHREPALPAPADIEPCRGAGPNYEERLSDSPPEGVQCDHDDNASITAVTDGATHCKPSFSGVPTEQAAALSEQWAGLDGVVLRRPASRAKVPVVAETRADLADGTPLAIEEGADESTERPAAAPNGAGCTVGSSYRLGKTHSEPAQDGNAIESKSTEPPPVCSSTNVCPVSSDQRPFILTAVMDRGAIKVGIEPHPVGTSTSRRSKSFALEAIHRRKPENQVPEVALKARRLTSVYTSSGISGTSDDASDRAESFHSADDSPAPKAAATSAPLTNGNAVRPTIARADAEPDELCALRPSEEWLYRTLSAATASDEINEDDLTWV